MPPQPELGIALRFLDRLVVAPFGLLTPNLLTSGSSLPSLSTLPIRGNPARYGTPWRKRLRVATNSSLGAWKLFCQCKHGRQQLRGRRPVLGECRPRVPRKVWRSVLQGCVAIARQTCACIGEAARPGPRRAKHPQGREGPDLEAQLLLSGVSRALGNRAWSSFLRS